jgi:hypothetical protein
MKCSKCNFELDNDDNFCPQCGEITAHGYLFLHDKNNCEKICGFESKQNNAFQLLLLTLIILAFILCGELYVRKENILKPIAYIKKNILLNKYNYNVSLIKTNNQYYNKNIDGISEAKTLIYKDLEYQKWQCSNNQNERNIEYSLEEDYGITSVNLCDISESRVQKLKNAIDYIYTTFPSIKGYLTNITITNPDIKDAYIAYFQPIYPFVNANNNINSYNKVNKTQILLNSYYYLNNNDANIKSDWFVRDTTWDSTIAHELGHFVVYVSLLKKLKIENSVFETKENTNQINNLTKILNDGSYSKSLVEESLNNFNNLYNKSENVQQFALGISNYAGYELNGNMVYDEILAEGIHDCYLHGEYSSKESLEIVKLLKEKLGEL